MTIMEERISKIKAYTPYLKGEGGITLPGCSGS